MIIKMLEKFKSNSTFSCRIWHQLIPAKYRPIVIMNWSRKHTSSDDLLHGKEWCLQYSSVKVTSYSWHLTALPRIPNENHGVTFWLKIRTASNFRQRLCIGNFSIYTDQKFPLCSLVFCMEIKLKRLIEICQKMSWKERSFASQVKCF